VKSHSHAAGHTKSTDSSNGSQFPALATVRVAVNYGKKIALNDVSFSVNAGEMVAVVGPNGAGKSSLFKALAGFISHGCQRASPSNGGIG